MSLNADENENQFDLSNFQLNFKSAWKKICENFIHWILYAILDYIVIFNRLEVGIF